LLIAQQPVLAASKESPGTTAVSSLSLSSSSLTKTTAQNTNIEAEKSSSTTTSINNLTRSYAEQIMAYCKDDIHCPVLALDQLGKTQSRQIVLGTFFDLILLHDESYHICHETAHHLGMWLYGYTTNLNEALSYAKPLLCAGATIHGVLQGYFQTEHVHNVDNNQTEHVHNVDNNQIMITHLCPVSQENVNWINERDGHGLAELYDYNATAAVARCNEFEPEWAQSACSRGVFMENLVHYSATGEGDFDSSNIYYPCDRTLAKFAPQCYYYHTPYLLNVLIRNDNSLVRNVTIEQRFDDWVKATFAQCYNVAPSEFVKYCYGGMGRLLFPIVYWNAEQAIAYCFLGNQSSYHHDCLIGMLKAVLKTDAEPDTGLQFCSLSKPDFKAECYEIVGMWIKTLYSDQEELERECSKVDDVEYVINCINANPEISVHIAVFEPV
jgi:hypothetical protein